MAGSTPPTRASRYSQRSSLFSSPDRPPCADFLSPDRNSELSHKEALAAAAAEHTRIREKANHTLQLYQEEEAQRRLAERQQQLIDLQQKEKQRLEKERSLRAEDERLRDLRAKSIARLPPEPELPKAPTAPVKQEATPTPQPTLSAQPQASTTPATANGATPATQPAASAPATSILNRTPTPAANSPTPLSNPAQQQTTQEPAKSASPLQPVANGQVKPEQSPTNGTAPSATPAHVPPPAPRVDPLKQRYLDIHKNLKAFRASYVHQMSTNPALKNHTADLRRDVRKFVGQISMDKANNRLLVQKLLAVFKQALANAVGSQLINPAPLVAETREPVEGAAHNAEMPSLLLYLLNLFAKHIIGQYILECGTNTRTADPIGIAAASIFSDPIFQWRGRALIDMLIAKFYVVCPVLFGIKGSDNTEQGRARVGWKRNGKNWIPEGEHQDRMFGLGAGYASIALRDFSKSKKQNPWPMRHYWECIARIVNTPPHDISNTQCLVLKALIEHYEPRFLQFYGTAAIAALRLALVEFPARAKAAGLKGYQVEFLAVHGQLLAKDYGLRLE